MQLAGECSLRALGAIANVNQDRLALWRLVPVIPRQAHIQGERWRWRIVIVVEVPLNGPRY
jgi:hypothetical protein